jgi:outer membrane protein OmpA-like peptidoglycan-associated protein
VTIDAVVLTPQYKSKAQSEIKTVLNQKTGENINLSLDQVVVAQEIIKEANSKLVTENALVASSQTQSPRYSRIDEMTKALEQATFFPTEYIKVEIDSKVAYIQAKIAKGVTIATLRQFEGKLTERHPGWTIKVIPPFQSLPFVYYQVGSDKLLQTEQDKLSDILWALNQWNITNVTVVGFASSAGELERFDNTSLAYRRATDVLSKIKTNGIAANARAEYRSFRQLQDEKSYGNYSFQRVEIRLNQPAEIAQLESNATPKHNPVKVSANQTRKILSTQSKPENKDEAAALSAISLSDKLWYFNSPSNTNVILDQFIIRSEKFASE